MHNAVVKAIAQALASRGAMALRFNFRGVGLSGGAHDNGRAEAADVRGALDFLIAQPAADPARLYLVGYSFGAWVGLAHAEGDPRVRAAAAVGLVAWHFSPDFLNRHARLDLGVEPWQCDPHFLESFAPPTLFVSGERDSLSPATELRGLLERMPGPKRLDFIPGADHSLRGYEDQVAGRVADYLIHL